MLYSQCAWFLFQETVTVVAGNHAVHAWRCFASYAIALKCALFVGVFLRDAFSRPVWLVVATVIG